MEILFVNSSLFESILLVGGCLIFSILGFIGNININTGDGNINISGADAEMELVDEAVEEADSTNLTDVIVNNPVGDVKILSSENNSVTLTKKLYVPKATSEDEIKKLKEQFQQAALQKKNNILELNIPKMSVLCVMTPRVDLEIAIPKKLNLKQIAGVNDIYVEDIEGNIELQNNVGNITLKRLSGKVSVHTNSGSINAHSLNKISTMTANTGDITASSIDLPGGKVKIVSYVGNVEVEINDVSKETDCEIKSNTGDVTLIINREANVSLEAMTNMGQLDIDPGINVTSKGQAFMGASVSALINQPDGKINVSSNTGSLNIKMK